MAENPLMYISESEREQAIARSRRKFQTDYQSDLATSYDNGRAEGIIEGKVEVKMEIARNLKEIGMSLDQIMQVTGLTYAEVEAL